MKKINGMIILSGILGIILLAIGNIYLFSESNEAKEEDIVRKYLNTSNEIEVYEDKYISDFIEVKNGILNDKKINTKQIGKKQVEFTYRNERGKEKVGEFEVNIVDKIPPIILISDTYTYTKNSNVNIEENVLCGDNYDKKPVCKIEGEYDLNQVGNYSVVYKAIDSSGNETVKPITLKVIEKSNSRGTVSKISLDEIKTKYQNENTILGIDVSKWQQEINFEEVKNNGIEFVMIRVGTQKGPKEDSIIDAYFKENIENAKKAGLKVGIYYYSYASSVKEAKNQAKWVIEQLDPYKIDLPVVFDWECYTFFNSFHISLYDLNEIADTFLKEIEKEGYEGMLYGSKNYLETIWKTGKYKTWLAHYTEKTTYNEEYLMWQFTNRGSVPGISTMVDVDVMKK